MDIPAIAAVVLLLLLLVLYIYAIVLVHADIKRNGAGNANRFWLSVIVLLPFIGPFFYFFFVRKYKK
jgi:hypothetical protein